MDFRGFLLISMISTGIILQAPSLLKKKGWFYVCTFWTFFWWVIFFSSLRPKKISPNKWSQKIDENAQIFGGTNLENFHFNRADVQLLWSWHLSLVVVGIYVEVTPSVGISVGQLPGAEPGFNTKCDLSRSVENLGKTPKDGNWNLNICWIFRPGNVGKWLDNWTYNFHKSWLNHHSKSGKGLQRVCGKSWLFALSREIDPGRLSVRHEQSSSGARYGSLGLLKHPAVFGVPRFSFIIQRCLTPTKPNSFITWVEKNHAIGIKSQVFHHCSVG